MQVGVDRAVWRRGRLLGLALALAVGLVATVVAGSARGEDPPSTLTAGGADWGVKQSFRTYIEGPIAHGAITTTGGATRNPDGTFHFPLASGTFDPASNATVARFAGSVHFSGHAGALDLDVSGVTAEITPEGTRLLADVTSKSLADGALVAYPNVELAALDLSAVDPVVDGGTTTWSAIPTALTEEGAPAFAGFYTAGTALDPFSFSYEGPGGKPTPEVWTEPGTPGYEEVAADAEVGGAIAMYPDRGHGVLHLVTSSGLRALDVETLAELGSLTAAAVVPSTGTAFDPVHETVFTASAAGEPVRAFSWDGPSGTYHETTLPITSAAKTNLAYATDTETLYAIENAGGPATPAGSTPSTAVAVAKRDGSGWEALTYPALATGGVGVSGLVAVGGGKLIATQYASYTGTPPNLTVTDHPILELSDGGSELSATPIAGTTPPAPASGFSFGYIAPVDAGDGAVTVVEANASAPTAHALTLTPGSGGYTAGTPVDVGASAYAVVADPADGTVYVTKPQLQSALVVAGGKVVTTLTEPPAGYAEFAPTVAAASAGTLYFLNNVAPTRLFAYAHTGDSPAVAAEPEDTGVEVVQDGTAVASFSAAATGTPTPAVQWQQRAAGEIGWSDLSGAGDETLAVTASAASAGNRYRAVFSNSAGRIATRPATLSVSVVTPPPGDGGGGGGAGSPEPAGGGKGGSGAADAASGDAAGAPAAVKPMLRVAAGPHRVATNGVATVATVTCSGSEPCLLRAPKRTRLIVAGKAYRAFVVAPGAVMAGSSASLQVRIPRRARAALANHRGRVSVRVWISSGAETVTRRFSAVLERGA